MDNLYYDSVSPATFAYVFMFTFSESALLPPCKEWA